MATAAAGYAEVFPLWRRVSHFWVLKLTGLSGLLTKWEWVIFILILLPSGGWSGEPLKEGLALFSTLKWGIDYFQIRYGMQRLDRLDSLARDHFNPFFWK